MKSTVGDEEFIVDLGDVRRHPIGVNARASRRLEELVVVEIKSPAPDIGAFFALAQGVTRPTDAWGPALAVWVF
mgnify:CR=1 FL=1